MFLPFVTSGIYVLKLKMTKDIMGNEYMSLK